MKKIIFLIALAVSCLSFTSCLDILSALITAGLNPDSGTGSGGGNYDNGDSEAFPESGNVTVIKKSTYSGSFGQLKSKAVTSKENYIDSTGRVFLVKVNESDSDVQGDKTGYVTDTVIRQLTENESFLMENSIPEKPFLFNEPFIGEVELQKKLKNGELPELINDSQTSRGLSSDYICNKSYSKGTKEYFYITPTKNNYAVQISATLVSVGTNCYVWSADSYRSKYAYLTQTDYDNIAKKFDSVYNKETNVFGSREINSTSSTWITTPDKVSILIYDIYGDSYKGQSSGTLGYFYTLDMYKGSKNSNSTEMFYIDDYFLKEYTAYTYSTLAHEFQHLLSFVHKIISGPRATTESWFTEMLSMICEEYLQNDLDLTDLQSPKSRLNNFNSRYYYGFEHWLKGDQVYYSYANAYAFAAYLVRNFGGINLIKNIALNNYYGEEAITQALRTMGYTSETFNTVLEKFYQVCLCTDELSAKSNYSLNKSNTDFSKIDLNNEYFRNTISNQYVYGPYVFAADSRGKCSIGKKSFSLHYVGKNLNKVTLNLPSNENVKMYLIYE